MEQSKYRCKCGMCGYCCLEKENAGLRAELAALKTTPRPDAPQGSAPGLPLCPRCDADTVSRRYLCASCGMEWPPAAPRGSAPVAVCRACSKPLLPENYRVADGCPCNSRGGVNHGLVAKDTCVCLECDPALTGSTRYPAAPQGSPLPGVPRGHCNRCERCGWELVMHTGGGCLASNCSTRPMPKPRTHCAGCGAVYDDVVTPRIPLEGGALEGELAEALRKLLNFGTAARQEACALLARYDAGKVTP